MQYKVECENDVLQAARQIHKFNLALIRSQGQHHGVSSWEPDDYGLLTIRNRLQNAILDYDYHNGNSGRGEWFFTWSGRRFWPFDPRPEDVHIEDIAHGLSLLCRFCGRISEFYSVAQHSVLVSYAVKSEAALAGLLHDSGESVIGDMIRPVKAKISLFSDMEDKIMRAICDRFGLDFDDELLWIEVKRGDNILLTSEFRDLDRSKARMSFPKEPPLSTKVIPWTSEVAEKRFLERFYELWQPTLATKASGNHVLAAAG